MVRQSIHPQTMREPTSNKSQHATQVGAHSHRLGQMNTLSHSNSFIHSFTHSFPHSQSLTHSLTHNHLHTHSPKQQQPEGQCNSNSQDERKGHSRPQILACKTTTTKKKTQRNATRVAKHKPRVSSERERGEREHCTGRKYPVSESREWRVLVSMKAWTNKQQKMCFGTGGGEEDNTGQQRGCTRVPQRQRAAAFQSSPAH